MEKLRERDAATQPWKTDPVTTRLSYFFAGAAWGSGRVSPACFCS
jgi:hypothetical protein